METKKVKISNSPGASIRTVDELNNKGKKLITKLNHDCLAKVFMHLPVEERLEMENVCQKWAEAVEFSWYNIKKLVLDDLMIPLDEKDETVEMIIIKCGRFLRHLTIDDNHYPCMSYVLNDNCKNINHFSINMNTRNGSEWKILKEDLVEIINSMPNLKYLKVEMSGSEPRDYSHEIVDKLPEDIHEIHLFIHNLDSVIDDDNNGYHQIAPDLERFNSLHCLTLKGFLLTNETLQRILENKKTLTKLDLSYSEYPSNPQSIFENLKNLEHLNLYGVKDFNEDEIVKIAHNCSRLTHFEFMNKIDGFSNEDVAMLPFNIYRELKYLNLVHLAIHQVDANGENVLSGMTENWKELKYLNIHKCDGFSRADLEEITKLKHLEFAYICFAKDDSELFIRIANNCPELKELPMSLDKISEAALFEVSNLKKIEKLYFWINDYLTGDLLERIANNCGNLVHLELSHCNNVTENSLIKVGKLKHLKILYIDVIKNIPNAMFDNFKKLEELKCLNCPSITDEGIIKVIDNCRKLSTLILFRTGITVESLVHASKRKFVFKLLRISVDSHVKNEYEKINCTPSPYLIVK